MGNLLEANERDWRVVLVRPCLRAVEVGTRSQGPEGTVGLKWSMYHACCYVSSVDCLTVI